MNLKKLICKGTILSLLALSIVSCKDDDNNDETKKWNPSEGAYILNQGTSTKNNDATLSFYDKQTKTIKTSIFETSNDGLHLGSTAQDMIFQNDTMYIAVFQSAVIYVTDLYGKVIKKIESTRDGQKQKPREFTAQGQYVYVTYFDGYLARIDKKTLEIDKSIKVGANPESVRIANGKLYVANSGFGSGNTLSVIDVNNFTVIKDIEVILNPTRIEVDKYSNIWLISMGNYDSIKNTLQKMNTTNETAEVIGNASLMKMSPDGSKIYTIYAQHNSDKSNITYKVYDTQSGNVINENFVDASVSLDADPFSLSIDPKTGDIYIAVSDYQNESTMYRISSSTGKLIHKFKVGGVTPNGAFFVK